MADVEISCHHDVATTDLLSPCREGGEHLVLIPFTAPAQERICVDADHGQTGCSPRDDGEAALVGTAQDVEELKRVIVELLP